MARGVIPAKLSAPKPQSAVDRPRLFARLDAPPGRVWICGPGGSGKTFLAASWLESRNFRPLWLQLDEDDAETRTLFHYIAAGFGRLLPKQSARMAALARSAPREHVGSFARGFARKLYEFAPANTALAFDHVESVAEHDAAMEALAILVSEAPPKVPILLMSRTELAPAFTGLRARSEIGVVDWSELRLTLDEAKQLIAARHAGTEAERLHALTDGWAAGLVLMSAWLEQQQITFPYPGLQRDALFGYFAEEFLKAVSPPVREFLLTAAQLPSMTGQTAAAVSGNARAEEILADLARRNFFTLRLPQAQGGYRFHPLLREFLMQQASRSLPAATLCQTRERAAAALEVTGDPAAAAEMYCALGAWERLEALLAAHGETLLAESRNRAVLGWVAQAPPAEFERRSWLRFWKCRALVELEPRAALGELEPTWQAFDKEASEQGLYQAWCAAVECCLATFDFRPLEAWLPRFRALDQRSPSIRAGPLARRVVASTYVALASWCPDAADFASWERQALELVRSEELPPDARLAIGSTLVYSWTFMGTDTSLAAEVIQRLRQLASSPTVSPRARLRWLWVDGMNGIRFDGDESLAATFRDVREAEAIIAEFGGQNVGMGLFIDIEMVANLVRGERAAADRAFARLLALPPARSAPEASRRAFLTALYALHCNQAASALQPARQHAEFEEKNGIAFARIYAQYILALALHVNDRTLEALGALSASKRLSVRYRSPGSLCWNYLGLALVALDKGSRARCARFLRAGLDIMVPLGHLRAFYLNREQMSRLLSVAFERGVHPEYVRRIIRIRRLAPPPGARDSAWPWALQIYALGGFDLCREGKSLAFSRKVPRKPLQILKFLVAHGMRAVRETAIVDALWPDESPAAGARAFATALHRLRRLIGEETIVSRDGMVAFNAACVWIDAREFDRLEPEQAIAFYRGPLLPGAHAEQWSLEARDRLRHRFIQAVDKIGVRAQHRAEWLAAHEIYQRALEVEPAAELLHQGAIRCQLAMGLHGEAVAAYRRCERALRSTFGVQPSETTRHLLESLQSVNKR